MRVPVLKPKTLTWQARLGQQGIALIEEVVLEMGGRWNASGPLESGVDGYIELYSPETGHALSLFLLVQSKAVKDEFPGETPQGFEYPCSARDIEYWLKGNAPVLLIVSRPSTREAYWVSLKSYFGDPSRRASRKVRFDKSRDRLTSKSLPDLVEQAAVADAGVHLGPRPKDERLITNLLEIAAFPSFVFTASTPFRFAGDVWKEFERMGVRAPGGWILKNKQIVGFHDLEEAPWSHVCDEGTVEKFDVREWADAADLERTHDFIRMLRRLLQDKLFPVVRYRDDLDCFIWTAPKSGKTQHAPYGSLKRNSKIAVFTPYTTKSKDGRLFTTYRHMAFSERFKRFDSTWFLEITPTYVFTRDGRNLDRFHASRLSGIKRLERNRAVLSQVLFWADLLQRERDLFSTRDASLRFGELKSLELPVGIEDEAWLQREPEDRSEEELPDTTGSLFTDED